MGEVGCKLIFRWNRLNQALDEETLALFLSAAGAHFFSRISWQGAECFQDIFPLRGRNSRFMPSVDFFRKIFPFHFWSSVLGKSFRK
jgi:hypothetical protein